MSELRFRQVHLDFHTSEHITEIGRNFEASQFQEMLRLGHVDSITLFAKCHHGLSYHDTNVGVRHPHMDEELLPRQIAACREVGVLTPIYISAGWDETAIRAHPEWGVKYKDGKTFDPLKPGWKFLCFNTPYLDYLCAQIEEVVDRFGGGNGIFLDIITTPRCYCRWCMAGMQREGVDPANDAAVDVYAQTVLQTYYERTTSACRKANPDRRVFHNSGHVSKGAPGKLHWNSHLELESLPTGGWGYDHFPISAGYAATTGYDYLGMTGKFHTFWGEFGGFKRPNALRYECAAMLAFGSKCSIGDQLHPRGEMNRDTYSLIGAAYSEVEEKEAWCRGTRGITEIALVSPEALQSDRPLGMHADAHAEEGAARMLLELHAQFDVVDLDCDLSPYRLVILPDEITLSEAFAHKITAYVEQGGRLLLSGSSGMRPDTRAGGMSFAIETGLEVVGRSEWDPDYIQASAALPTALVRGPFVIHGGAWNVRPKAAGTMDTPNAAGKMDTPLAHGTMETLAGRRDPYFNRAFDHFCSHIHTPDAQASEYPAVIGNSQIVYFAHNIFTRYRRYGQPLYRDLVSDAIRLLLGDLSITASLPTTGRVTLRRQESEDRYVLHLLYGAPSLRGSDRGGDARALEIIEDLIPLSNITCQVQLPKTVDSVRLVPSGEALPFTQSASGAVAFTVPQVLCHQMVELR